MFTGPYHDPNELGSNKKIGNPSSPSTKETKIFKLFWKSIGIFGHLKAGKQSISRVYNNIMNNTVGV